MHLVIFRVTQVVLSCARTQTTPRAGMWAASCRGASSVPIHGCPECTRTCPSSFPGYTSRWGSTMTTTPSQKTYKRRTMKWHHFGIYKSKHLTIICPKKGNTPTIIPTLYFTHFRYLYQSWNYCIFYLQIGWL